MGAQSDRSLDDVVADILGTIERLDAASDHEERVNLRSRLNRLRAEASDVRGPAVQRLSDEELDRRIRSVQRTLAEIRSQRYDPSMVAGASGHGGGLDPMLTARHNQRVDEAGGRQDLEALLRQYLEEAARRR